MEILWSWAREIISAICEILPLSGDGQSGLINQIYMSLTGNGSGEWFGIFARAGLLVSLIAYLKEPVKNFGKAAAGIFRDIINKRFTFKYEDAEKKYALFVAGGWLPLIPAFFLSGVFVKVASGNMALAVSFFISGLFLVMADRIKKGKRDKTEVLVTDGPVIGFFRFLGVIPGISATGGTLFAALLSGYNEKTAFEYSLILLLPSVLAGLIVRITGALFALSLYEVLGSVMSLAAGMLGGGYAIRLLEKLVCGKKMKYLSVVLFAEAIIAFVLFLRG